MTRPQPSRRYSSTSDIYEQSYTWVPHDERRKPDAVSTAIAEIALMALPFGAVVKGGRALNFLIKGASKTNILRRGKSVSVIRDTSSGRFISQLAYRNRPGLYSRLRQPDRYARAMGKRAEEKIVRTRTYRAYSKYRGAERLLEGPQHWLVHKYTPRSVKVGMFLYGLGTLARSKLATDSSKEPETRTDLISFYKREPLVFNEMVRLPPTLRGILTKKSGLRTPRRSSEKRRCPPGHRWSSRLRKCVRVNGRRA